MKDRKKLSDIFIKTNHKSGIFKKKKNWAFPIIKVSLLAYSKFESNVG